MRLRDIALRLHALRRMVRKPAPPRHAGIEIDREIPPSRGIFDREFCYTPAMPYAVPSPPAALLRRLSSPAIPERSPHA